MINTNCLKHSEILLKTWQNHQNLKIFPEPFPPCQGHAWPLPLRSRIVVAWCSKCADRRRRQIATTSDDHTFRIEPRLPQHWLRWGKWKKPPKKADNLPDRPCSKWPRVARVINLTHQDFVSRLFNLLSKRRRRCCIIVNRVEKKLRRGKKVNSFLFILRKKLFDIKRE